VKTSPAPHPPMSSSSVCARWQRTIGCLARRSLSQLSHLLYCEAMVCALCTATHCNAIQHTATRCNTLQHAATRCNTLQHAATRCNVRRWCALACWLKRRALTIPNKSLCTHSSTLQHTATHFNTLQHTASHCNTLQHTALHCNTLQHTATHYSIL